MILILADSFDPWATLVHREAQRTGGDVCWIEPSHLLDRTVLNWPVETSAAVMPGSLIVDGRLVPFDELTGVFSRINWPLSLQLDDLDPRDAEYVRKETTASWFALLTAVPCAVVNRPVPGGRPTLLAGSSKLRQLVEDHGILLPPSRSTTSQADAILQFSAWSERAYLKALGVEEMGVYLQARDGADQICRLMERFAVTLQSVPEGQRVIVYVAGREVAATVIQANGSSAGDCELPFLPMEEGLALARALGLEFAECHFIVTSERQLYCLDITGAPNYWRCPQHIQHEIVGRLVRHLSDARSASLHDSSVGADGRSSAGERLR